MIYFFFIFFVSYLSVNYEKYKEVKYLEHVVFFILFLIIGLRFRTGGDFRPYLERFDYIATITEEGKLPDIFNIYDYINFLSHILSLNIFGTNIICSFLFTYFLYFFLKKFKNVYFSLVLAFPVLVMVYGIGSIRQGLSIALFLSIFSLRYEIQKVIAIFLGLLFHSSSIIYLFVYLGSFLKGNFLYLKIFVKKNINLILFWLLLIIVILFFKTDQYIKYIKYYFVQDVYTSPGFILRQTPTFLCAIIYYKLYLNKNLIMDKFFNNIFLIISVFSLLLFPLGLFYSTIADRIMGYFLPLQIVLINTLYVKTQKKYKQIFNYFFCIYSIFFLGVWYFFGNNSKAWIYEFFFLPIKFW
jgi:hypothetical protein